MCIGLMINRFVSDAGEAAVDGGVAAATITSVETAAATAGVSEAAGVEVAGVVAGVVAGDEVVGVPLPPAGKSWTKNLTVTWPAPKASSTRRWTNTWRINEHSRVSKCRESQTKTTRPLRQNMICLFLLYKSLFC